MIRTFNVDYTKYITKSPNLAGLVDPESWEWYRSGSSQNYIPENALSEKGKDQYRQVCDFAEKEKPIAILQRGFLFPVETGIWVPDSSSRYYNEEECVSLHDRADFCLVGETENGSIVQSERIRWKGVTSKGQKWAFTTSGKLYYYTDQEVA